VVSCSLLPSATYLPPTRTAYFAGLDPVVPYLVPADPAPLDPAEVLCAKPCLPVLNAAECGAAEPVRGTSGVGDAMEMARQVQSPELTWVMWSYMA
jgi:hypothetical protein